MKQCLGKRLTTVFPRQGHYALDVENMVAYPSADIALERISELVEVPLISMLGSISQAKGNAGTTD